MLRSLDRQYQDQYRLRQRRRFAFKFSLILGLITVAVMATLYWLFWSGAFALENLQIDNTSHIEQAELAAAVDGYLNERWFFIPRRNNIFFLVDNDTIANILLRKFPGATEISVQKDFPKTLNITLRVRNPVGVWCFKVEPCFFFDNSGWLMKLANHDLVSGTIIATDPDEQFLFKVEDHRSTTPLDLGESLNSELFSFVMAINNGLTKQSIFMSRVVLPNDDPFQAIFQTDENWRLITATNQPASQQLNALAVVLEKKVTAKQRLILQYIDVQLPNRVYYK